MEERSRRNSSVLILRPLDPQLPVMVSGAGRSGTTALARAISGGGYRNYADAASPSAEEYQMIHSWAKADLKQVNDLVQSRSGRWLSKVPNACVWAAYRPGWRLAWTGNWVITTRDPLASAWRDPGELNHALGNRMSIYISVIESARALAQFGYGVALVCMEKVLLCPDLVLSDLKLELDVDAGSREVIVEDERYLS